MVGCGGKEKCVYYIAGVGMEELRLLAFDAKGDCGLQERRPRVADEIDVRICGAPVDVIERSAWRSFEVGQNACRTQSISRVGGTEELTFADGDVMAES